MLNIEYLNSLIQDSSGLWYTDGYLWGLINDLFVNPKPNLSYAEKKTKRDLLVFFRDRLMNDQITFGNKPELFNDFERYVPHKGWVSKPTTVVIHHTGTINNWSYDILNALHLLAHYVPAHMNSERFKVNGERQPISSGHYFRGRETFLFYTWLVYNRRGAEGNAIPILNDRYVGFYSDDWRINGDCIHIAIVGHSDSTIPKDETIETVNQIIARYPTVTKIVRPCDVPKYAGNTYVSPDEVWLEWQHLLHLPSQ